MSYANNTQVQVYQYFPEEDGDSGPFQILGVVVNNYDGFLQQLEKHAIQIQEHKAKPSHYSRIEGCNEKDN